MSKEELPSSYQRYRYLQKSKLLYNNETLALGSHGKAWKASCNMKEVTSGLVYKQIRRRVLKIRYKGTQCHVWKLSVFTLPVLIKGFTAFHSNTKWNTEYSLLIWVRKLTGTSNRSDQICLTGFLHGLCCYTITETLFTWVPVFVS